MENGKCGLALGLTNGLGMGSSEFHVIRTTNEVLNQYVFVFLNRESIRKEAEKRMTGASGHRRVPVSYYEDIRIPVPSIDLQLTIIKRLEDLEKEIIQKFLMQ